MYRFLFTIVFFGKRKNNTHKTFHILNMKAHFEKETHFENESSLQNPFWKWKLVSIDFGSSSCWKGEKLSKGSLLEKRKREREMFAFPKHSKVCVHCRVVIWHTHMWAFQMTDWLVMLGTAKQTYCSLVQCAASVLQPVQWDLSFYFILYSKLYIPSKVEKILKGSLDSISSPLPSVKSQIMGWKVCLRCKGKTLLGVVNKLLKTKSFLTSPSNVLPYHLK